MNREELGKYLREYRRRRGYEVKDVKQIFLDDYQMKVSEKTIYNWESNQYNISVPKLLALCEIYEIKDLSVKAENLDAGEEPLHITQKEQQIIMAYRKNEDLQHAIDKLLGI